MTRSTREIKAFDNRQAWQNAVCGNNPNMFLPGPNTQPPCRGLNAPGAAPAGYPTYPGLGTGYSAGFPAAHLQRFADPAIGACCYLRPGPTGSSPSTGTVSRPLRNYDAFHDAAPETGSSNTGASGGLIGEESTGFYARVQRRRRSLRQSLALQCRRALGADRPDDWRSRLDRRIRAIRRRLPAATLADGARYPNIVNFVFTENTYENWLPAANVAFNVFDNVVRARCALADDDPPESERHAAGPQFQLAVGRYRHRGNPALAPFLSDNIDIGFEYYTGGEGYFGVAAFHKGVEGFTVNGANDRAVHRSRRLRRHLRHADADAAGGHQIARRPERRDGRAHSAGQCRAAGSR